MHHIVFPVYINHSIILLTLEKKCINRVHKGMIDNPIYVGGSGPVYDSIVTQPERIQSTGSDQKDTCITNPHYESLHVSNSNTKADTDRYIGRPIQHSLNSCHASGMAYQNEMQCVRCNSTSASATTMTGLKSNGQPRNKLGLTLFLGGRDSTMGDNTPEGIMQGVPKVSFVELGNGEEPYAIMNPASSLVQRGQEKELQQIKGNRK